MLPGPESVGRHHDHDHDYPASGIERPWHLGAGEGGGVCLVIWGMEGGGHRLSPLLQLHASLRYLDRRAVDVEKSHVSFKGSPAR